MDRGLELVAVDIYPNDRLEDFIAFWRSNADTDVVFAKDHEAELIRSFSVLSLGQTTVIDREGYIVYNGSPLDYDGLKKIVERVI